MHSTPPLGGPYRNIAITFGMEKLEWWGYPKMKNVEDMYDRLDKILTCDRQRDGRTDKHLDTA